MKERLLKIRCLLMDVDGVLTDGKIHFTSDGEEFKSFDVQDGHGMAMANRAGLLLGLVSGRPSQATLKRAADLGVNIVKQGPVNKWDMVEEIKREHNLADDVIAFIGDDLVDLPVLRRAGLAVAVPNAVAEVKAIAHYTTKRPGGNGAVREVIEMILKAQGSWEKVIAKYMALILAGLFLVTGAIADSDTNKSADAATGYIEKFEVPERDEAGNLKWKLSGDRATIRPDGLMNIHNARAEFYTSNRVDLVFTSPVCLLDRLHNRAATDAPVRIERENMIITGIGGDWDGNSSSISIRSNIQVIIKNAESLQP